MLNQFMLAAALVAATALVNMATRHLRVPHSILLVLAGVGLAAIPQVPTIAVDPDVVLLLFLPPLLYASGVGMSWRGFRIHLRPILMMAVGGVLVTATAVAAAGHWLLGLPWAVAFVLGAVVSPPDPVAPMAIAKRLKLPSRVLTVLEGEGLANDATALILLSFGIAAVASGSISMVAATGQFVAVVAGEIVWGVAVAAALMRFRALAKDAQVEIVIALLTPFVAFWPPHLLGGSGVLAAVAGGLYASWNGRRLIAPTTRLQGFFVWGLVVHLIEGLLFLMMGLQARVIAEGIGDGGWPRLLYAGAVVAAVVVAVRFVWVFPAAYLPRALWPGLRDREAAPSWQSVTLIGFTGIRGAVSLAAALSIPLLVGGEKFPDRTLILFVTFVVILVTLVGQGGLLPLVIRSLGLDVEGEAEAADAKAREVVARVKGVDAALAELDRRAADGAPRHAVAVLRRRHADRRAELAATADERVEGSPLAATSEIQACLIEAERRAIGDLYAAGEIGDDARRRIERELDLEDARNRHALESATGDALSDPEAERLEG